MGSGVDGPAIGQLVATTRVTAFKGVESAWGAHTALSTSLVSKVSNATGVGPAAGSLFVSAQEVSTRRRAFLSSGVPVSSSSETELSVHLRHLPPISGDKMEGTVREAAARCQGA
jgi:hypothetical protein